MTDLGKVAAIRYDRIANRLSVTFEPARRFVFADVPPSVAQAIDDFPDVRDALERFIIGRYAWVELGTVNAGSP